MILLLTTGTSYNSQQNNSHGGTLVTYGGMSKKPFAVPTVSHFILYIHSIVNLITLLYVFLLCHQGQLIFNDIRLRGFWRTGWDRKQNPKSKLDFQKAFLLIVSVW